MSPLRSLRTRPGATLATLAWVLGTVVLPVRHLVQHARPHDHEGGGIHYHLDGDAAHEHGDEHDDDDDEPGGPFTVEAPHGQHHPYHDEGLAHFAVATGEGAAESIVLLSERDPERVPHAPPTRDAEYFLEGREPARGPPAA